MSKFCYTPKKFASDKLEIIRRANEIIAGYQAQGYDLTLRQIYYRFVAQDLFPNDRCYSNHGGKWVFDPSGTKNAPPNYTYLGEVIGDARLAGLIDWDAIVDRTRNLRAIRHHVSPKDLISEVSQNYSIWKWENQPNYVEVWVEKDALLGIVGDTCNRLDVPFFSCRGYTSISEMHSAAMRLKYESRQGKVCRIIHLGDHDPSGIDMSRDIKERIGSVFGVDFKLHRVALNRDQIERYNPPPNPAKVSDSRAKDYISKFGDWSWELDALDPADLSRIIESNVKHWRVESLWEEAVAKEKHHRNILFGIAQRWDEVQRLIQNPPEE